MHFEEEVDTMKQWVAGKLATVIKANKDLEEKNVELTERVSKAEKRINELEREREVLGHMETE